MKNVRPNERQPAAKAPARLLAALTALVLCGLFGGPSCSAATPAEGQTPVAVSETSAGTADGATPIDQPDPIAEKWGVEITSIRLTAHDHMIDYRYKVLDATKAADLFRRQIKPALIHEDTGKVLVVPDTAKLGPLRNSDIPKEGKIYWMFFGNANNLVKAGDKVTIVIGDFRVEDLIVE